MKLKVFILLSLFGKFAFGQNPYILDEQFNSAPTLSAPWTSSGTALTSYATNGSSAAFGRNSNALGFSASGQIIKYGPWVGSADLIFFDCYGIGGTGSTFLVEESVTGLAGSWTSVGTVTVITTVQTFQASLLNTSRYIQVTFTKNTVNSSLDDLRIRKTASCSGSSMLISSALINGTCGAASCENDNEFVTFMNGSSTLHVDSLEIILPVSTTSIAAGAAIGGFGFSDNTNIKWLRQTATNTAYTALLNTTAGCTLFLDIPASNRIPANAKVIAFTGSNPDAVYNFSATCGTGNVYVVYANKSDCSGSGKLPNGNCSPTGIKCNRYISIINNNTGCIDTKMYLNGTSANPTGALYYWGTVNTIISSACNSFVVLPVELLDFYATKNTKGNDITWKVAQEENILYYIVEKSIDGYNFTEFATVYANNETGIKSYSIFDNEPNHDIIYYRLSTKGTNNTTKNYKIISLDEVDNKWEYIHYQTENNMVLEFKNSLPKNSVVSLFDISGKELIMQPIKQSRTILNIDALSSGVYFVRLSTPYKTEHFKIIISK